MYFLTLINWTSPFPILELLGGIFHFYSNFKRKFCLQTVENLIRRHILRRLIWFYTVCRCPTKRTLGLYGLIECFVNWRAMTQMHAKIYVDTHQGWHCLQNKKQLKTELQYNVNLSGICFVLFFGLICFFTSHQQSFS